MRTLTNELEKVDDLIAAQAKRIAELEAMLRAAGYSDEQIAAGTPYIEVMGG